MAAARETEGWGVMKKRMQMEPYIPDNPVVNLSFPIDAAGHLATLSIPGDIPFLESIDSLLFQLGSYKDMLNTRPCKTLDNP